MHLGVALVALAADVTLIAYRLPWFSTPVFGGWILSNYPFTLTEGLFIFYVCPLVAALITLAVVIVAPRTRWLHRAIGLLDAILGMYRAGNFFVSMISLLLT